MGISAHDLIFGSFDFPFCVDNSNKYFWSRRIGAINKDLLISDAFNQNWNAIFNISDVDEQALFFESNIISLLDSHAPLVKVKISNDASDKFRFSQELIILSNIRDYYGNIWRRSRSNESHRLYKIARNNFNNAYRKEKADFDAKHFNPKLPPKVLFRKLREINALK
jgi:hypothetical protein